MAITVTVTETPTYVTVNETNTAVTLNQSDNPITVTTTTDLTFPANQHTTMAATQHQPHTTPTRVNTNRQRVWHTDA